MMFNTASVLVTEDCNLRCTYCFENHKKNRMTVEVAEKMLLWLFDNESKNNNQEVGVTLFGGEPCLNEEVCVFIIERGYQLSQKYNIGFNVSMITNCTFLPTPIADTFTKYLPKMPLSVQLSVDGTPDVHDQYRVLSDGLTGSWSMVEKTIPKWKEVFKDHPDSLNIHGCLNKKTIHTLYESYKFFKYVLEIPRIWFLPVCEEDWEEMDVAVYKEQNRLIYEDIMKDVRENGNHKSIMDVAPFDKSMGGMCSDTKSKPCAAGSTYCCVTANGDVYPCHQFYYTELGQQMKLGSVFEGIDYSRTRIFNDYDGGDLDCDKDCDHGGCYRCIAVNWDINNSIFTQKQGFYCDMMKVDQYYQNLIRKEINKMGVTGVKTSDKCQVHTSDVSGGCDVVVRQGEDNTKSSCQVHEPVVEKKGGCADGACSCGDKPDNSDTLAAILIYQKNMMKEIQDLKVAIEVRNRRELE